MGERYLDDDNGTDTALHVGFSVYRHPRGLNTTNTVTSTVILPAGDRIRLPLVQQFG